MRVLYWSELFWPYIGGGEIFGSKLISDLCERGYEFAVVTSHDYLDLKDEEQYNGVPIYRLPFRNVLRENDIGRLGELSRQVRRLKQTFQPELIHINAVSPSVLFHLRTGDAHPAPTLVRMNTQALTEKGSGFNTLTAQMLRGADWVCCVSANSLKEVNHLVPEIKERSSIIYNGLEVSPIFPEPLPIDKPCLLVLGRLVPAKGFDLALTALASIIGSYPNLSLVIAGDGAARSELEQQVTALGLNKVVKFVGWVEPSMVTGLINQATIVLMPSRREGFPSVALQAASMARPIVATRVGGLEEIVAHQETGLLVEKGDIRSLADSIRFLLDNPQLSIRMGMTARRRVQEFFSWHSCVAAYDVLYRRLIVGNETKSRHTISL